MVTETVLDVALLCIVVTMIAPWWDPFEQRKTARVVSLLFLLCSATQVIEAGTTSKPVFGFAAIVFFALALPFALIASRRRREERFLPRRASRAASPARVA